MLLTSLEMFSSNLKNDFRYLRLNRTKTGTGFSHPLALSLASILSCNITEKHLEFHTFLLKMF